MSFARKTLAIIKPDVSGSNRVVETIREKISSSGLKIKREKTLQLDVEKASEFYKEHRGRFFYPRLVKFMSRSSFSIKSSSPADRS